MGRTIILSAVLMSALFLLYACDEEQVCSITGTLNVSSDPDNPNVRNTSVQICPGDRVALLWSASNAQTVSIEADNVPDVGTVDGVGSIVVAPSVSTTYTLVTSSNDCQALPIAPTVRVTVFSSPMSFILTALPANESAPDWKGTIESIQVSNQLVATSINGITLTDIDGNALTECTAPTWRFDKDGTSIPIISFPTLANPPFNPAGQYTLTATGVNTNEEFMTKCVRLYANLDMTFACPGGN